MPTLDDLRRIHPDIADDFTIPQRWEHYGAQDHAIWKTLFERQADVLPGRAAREFLDGLQRLKLGAESIPDFEKLSEPLCTDRLAGGGGTVAGAG